MSALSRALLQLPALLLTLVACVAAGLIDPMLGLSEGQPPVLQIRLGVAFSAILMFGPLHVLPAALADGLLSLMHGGSPLPAIAHALALGVVLVAAVRVLRTYPLQPFPRMRADHYGWFLGAALAVAILHAAVDAWSPDEGLPLSDWTLHAAAQFAGALLVVQLVAGWSGVHVWRRVPADLPRALPWMLIALAVAAAIFLRLFDGPEPYMLVLPAVLVWAAITLKVRWMALLLVLMNLLALYGTRNGTGPFGNETPLRALLLLQTFLIAMSVAVYSLSITLSERATASRRARTREAQLLDLVDGSIQGILIHREFRPLYANRRAAELLGFHSVADLMAQRSLAGIVVPDDLARISSEQSRRQLAAGRMLPMQLDVIRQDCSRRTLDSMVRHVMWDGERAVQATFIDVTDDLRARQEQRERLERQEKQLAAMLRLGVDPLLSVGDELGLCVLTEAVSEALSVIRVSVWQLDADQMHLVCLDLFDRRALHDRSGLQAHQAGSRLAVADYPGYFDALRGGQPVVANDARACAQTREFASLYLNDAGIEAMLDAPVFLDGRLAGVVCIEHDGGTRDWAHDEVRFAGEIATLLGRFLVARARRDMQREQDRLSAILDATPDYVSTVDTELRFRYLNLAARRTLGLSDGGELPTDMRVRDLYTPDMYRHYLEVQLPAVLRDGIWVGEIELKTPVGGVRPVSAVRVAHRDADGRLLYISSLLRDITAIKQTELALREANETLEQRVSERTAELARANERLKDLDRLKSMFIASMSHELRTPLNSIIGFTGVVLAGMAGELNERQRDQLGRVYGSARHLLALITDVIDISKIEAGFIDVFEETFEVEKMIDEAIQTVMPGAREKKLAVEVQVPPGLMVRADRRRLLQCVLNFTSNAVKYTVEGRIRVEASVHGSWLDISVEDTGIGVDEAGLARLFQPFERIDSHLRVKTPGTGLGLYLTRKIATELLAGGVDVHSTPGVGSRFTLRIPREGSGRAAEGARP
ncbi:ATP-binding protein [Methyloversatilis thermotolerans]|uniref:ATP-binding protein n=1 Tax=Methyloversatilis thermotolerans TaxID=1346290 RepID=UPI0003A3314D|nr:ATP-binding protein [Methyloversatilis thermotolerans]